MNDNYGGIPIKDEYIPRHANNYYIYNKRNDKLNNNNKKIHVKKKKRKLKRWVWNVLLIFFVLLTGISIYKIILWNNDNIDTSKIVNEINQTVDIKETEDNENTELVGEPEEEENVTPSDYWYYIKFPLIDVDFTELKKKNPDTVGWINVNNTNINYPYVQTSDNSYYLNHSFDKSYNDAGWVFIDYRNSSDLNNRNTILYAHSRLDKTMFGSLSKVLKSNWYSNKDNHIIRISTDTENTLWQIFSVYKIEEESYYITTDFSDDDKYVTFLNTLESRSLYDFNTTLTSSDKILTLSTCYSETERTVVHAKLIKKSLKEVN
ncbi:MAG: class B sortase [Bacilli bacterium]|nr:class B sortase [Bacilli bacterium]